METPVELRGLVVATGIAAFGACLTVGHVSAIERPGTMLAIVALAALAACRPVRVEHLRMKIVPTHPFVLIALAALGPSAALLVAVAGVTAAAFGRERTPVAMRLFLNLGSVVLGATAAAWVFAGTGGVSGRSVQANLWPLIPAAAAYFLCNSGVVAAAIALETRRTVVGTWCESMRWSAWSALAGLMIAIAGLALLDQSPALGLAFVALPCLLLVGLYRSQAESAAARRKSPL